MDINVARERLLKRRDELRQRASDASADLRHESDPLSADFAEQVTQRENDDVLGAISHSARAELQQVEAALRRLDFRALHQLRGVRRGHRAGAAGGRALHRSLPHLRRARPRGAGPRCSRLTRGRG